MDICFLRMCGSHFFSQHVGLIAECMPIYKIIIAALFLYLQYYFYSIIVCVSKFVTSVKV